jgi:hypothetical protein
MFIENLEITGEPTRASTTTCPALSFINSRDIVGESQSTLRDLKAFMMMLRAGARIKFHCNMVSSSDVPIWRNGLILLTINILRMQPLPEDIA